VLLAGVPKAEPGAFDVCGSLPIGPSTADGARVGDVTRRRGAVGLGLGLVEVELGDGLGLIGALDTEGAVVAPPGCTGC
jgi:hypothetical protein